MFAIDEYVFFGTAGVCRITDIVSEAFGAPEKKAYYVLQPLHDRSLAYVPADDGAASRVRRILKRDEIFGLINDIPGQKSIWIEDERSRREVFTRKLGSGDSHELMRLVSTLYREKQRKSKAGKRISSADAKIMASAEKLLNEELAFVLQIDAQDVPEFIRRHLPGDEPSGTAH